ncbi:MAG: radical SAM protein, partial [Oscillospiraceae bacterium]|nr:radical SAM protein [Oscillospiraceae bacterium]
MAVQTTAVMIQSLCVPCRNRCRYCLLSWDGRTEGAPWDRSVRLARRFREELRLQRPGVSTYFTFGYSMEHPDLREALRTLRSLGSPMAEFLQCDGMKMRSEEECAGLMTLLREEGVRELNFTVYGPPAYHDAFAGRKGDHALLLRMMRAAKREGIPFDTGIPLTRENIGRTEETVRT